MADPQAPDVVIVDGSGREHHFPPGFDPKRAASIVSQTVAQEIHQRPLLMGNSDAGVAQQLPNDPDAMAQVNAAKDRMANVGIGAGAATLLPVLAEGAAPGVLGATAKGLGYIGGYKALTTMGVPPEAAAILMAGGARAIGGIGGPKGAPTPTAEPVPESPIMTPTRMVGARMAGTPSGSNFSLSVPSPSGMASLEAAAPTVDRPVGQPSPNAFVPVKSINPADMPRDWHAFLDPEARMAADPLERAQAAGLHKETMANDARYRAATALERAQFQANPPNIQDLLLGLLTRPGGQ